MKIKKRRHSYNLGFLAEEHVALKLHAHGWQILERNKRYKGSELDIIATKSERLVCIEVKARRHCQDPSALLPPRKIQCIRRGLNRWISENEGLNIQHFAVWLCLVNVENFGMEWTDLSDFLTTEKRLE